MRLAHALQTVRPSALEPAMRTGRWPRCLQFLQSLRWHAALALTSLSVLPLWAVAFGSDGHQAIGSMADTLIHGQPAEAKVRALLLPGETLASVATWADCAKGYCGPLTPEMHTFVAANPHHHDYHFTDIPFQESAYARGALGTTDHDVVVTLSQCIAVLQGQTDIAHNPHQFTPRQALLLLVHLVGDVHQPLHVGSAYVDAHDHFIVPANEAALTSGEVLATQGDNDLLLGSHALHSYWDTDVVKSVMSLAKVKTPQALAQRLLARKAPPATTGDLAGWPDQWANETLGLSRRVHAGLILGAKEAVQDRMDHPHWAWPVQAPANYTRQAPALASQALSRAGYRLAAVLQAIWP